MIDDVVNGIAERLEERERNIRHTMHRLATEETARFVQANMYCADVFESAEDLLDWAIDQAPPGPAAEFGVAYGVSLARIAAKRYTYGFDSFKGLPEDWRSGFLAGTFSECTPPDIPNTELRIGLFADTVPLFDVPVAFLHVDCDLYSSTVTALQVPLLPGAVIVFDEYFHFPGWKQHEYAALIDSGLTFDYLAYNNRAEQVAIRIKEAS